MKKLIFLLTVMTLLQTNAQNKTIEPKGAFKEIDIASQKAMIERLFKNNSKKQRAIDAVLLEPNNYNPTVLYAMSRGLFDQDKKDEAAYWFYVAQLRARYDANLCMDESAKQAAAILTNMYGPDINSHAIKDLDKLKEIVVRVVDFVRTNNENYDHRWINLHGMQAMIAAMEENHEAEEMSKPVDQWSEIKAKTIDEYYKGFVEGIASLKK